MSNPVTCTKDCQHNFGDRECVTYCPIYTKLQVSYEAYEELANMLKEVLISVHLHLNGVEEVLRKHKLI